ncbi:MAG: SPOR domain-containing protein [Ruthenibacterium sp.]
MIARAIANALAAAFHLVKKSSAPPVKPPVDVPDGTLNRVQIGAFSVKANADAMLQKAKDAGFESAFIKQGNS